MRATYKSGFTLVEIMIVVVIIGLLAAMAIPAFQRARESSQNTRFANDIRVFAAAMETFTMENGVYPEDSNSGVIPTGMGSYIRAEQWNDGPSIGGSWDVELDSFGVRSAIGAHEFIASIEQLTDFDRQYDDGDLSNGKYRRLAANRYYYIVAE
jgi:type IV pilus assembly protein PilA